MNRHHPVARLLKEHLALAALFAVNLIAFLLQGVLPDEVFTSRLSCRAAEVAGAFGPLPAATLLTYAFLHADLGHLGMNLFYLWVFGFLVGELLGNRWVLAVYLFSAASGGVCFTVFHAETEASVIGASGAASGFMGAYLGLSVRHALPDPQVWPMARPVRPIVLAGLVLLGLYLDFSGAFGMRPGVTAYEAHLGGAVAGLFLTSFVTPAPRAIAD